MLTSIFIPKKLIYIAIILLTCLIAWVVQHQLVLNCDLSWDLLAAKRLYHGGSYTNDFFDLNPPLIFYLLIPPTRMTDYFHIPISIAFHSYLLIISLFSLWLCNHLLQQLFRQKNLIVYSILAALASIYWILPSNDYGEREHFFILLIMPYIFCVACRLSKIEVRDSLAFFIGVLAALGFTLKPYFLLTPILLEAYFLIDTRRWFAWVKTETLIILSFIVLYIVFIYIYHRDYISTIIPLANHYYSSGMSDPWFDILTSPWTLYCFFALGFFSFTCYQHHYKKVSMVLFLSLCSFLCAHFLQQKNWYYHIYPAISLSILLNILLFFDIFKKNNRVYFSTIMIGGLIFTIPLYIFQETFASGKIEKDSISSLDNYLNRIIKEKSVYLLSTSAKYFSPAFIGGNYISKYLHLFWLPGIINQDKQNPDENKMIQSVTEDILVKNPDFIIVDTTDYKMYLYEHSIDFVQYFSKNATFKKIWNNYHFLKSITISHYNLKDAKDWSLYVVPDKENTPFIPKEEYAVILTGNNPKKAFFKHNNQWLKTHIKHSTFIERTIKLSEEELKIIEKHWGLIEKNSHNQHVINRIINSAIHEPIFEFSIYAKNQKDSKL